MSKDAYRDDLSAAISRADEAEARAEEMRQEKEAEKAEPVRSKRVFRKFVFYTIYTLTAVVALCAFFNWRRDLAAKRTLTCTQHLQRAGVDTSKCWAVEYDHAHFHRHRTCPTSIGDAMRCSCKYVWEASGAVHERTVMTKRACLLPVKRNIEQEPGDE